MKHYKSLETGPDLFRRLPVAQRNTVETALAHSSTSSSKENLEQIVGEMTESNRCSHRLFFLKRVVFYGLLLNVKMNYA
jgi:hypothetical protein